MTVKELLHRLWGEDLKAEVRLAIKPSYPSRSKDTWDVVDVLPKDDRGVVWVDIRRIIPRKEWGGEEP
jgi:hypothetical protein